MAKLADLKDLLAKARASRLPDAAESSQSKPSEKRRAPPHGAATALPIDATPAAPASARRAVAASKHANTDVDLATAFADVVPLPPSRKVAHAPVRPPPVPAQRIADAAEALAASKYGSEPAPQHWEIGQEHEAEQTYLRRGMPSDVLAKLRRGHWTVQGELDLHRMTTTQAHDALADFLEDARVRGLRCVRVIHGKGLGSAHKEPVLKGKVRKWLSRWDDVLAYCEAPAHAGGGGAVLVLLRGR